MRSRCFGGMTFSTNNGKMERRSILWWADKSQPTGIKHALLNEKTAEVGRWKKRGMAFEFLSSSEAATKLHVWCAVSAIFVRSPRPGGVTFAGAALQGPWTHAVHFLWETPPTAPGAEAHKEGSGESQLIKYSQQTQLAKPLTVLLEWRRKRTCNP